MNERELTTRALNQFEFHTGLTTKVTEHGDGGGQNPTITALVEFNNNSRLVAQLKRCSNVNVNKEEVDLLIKQINCNLDGVSEIFVADYIGEELGLRLREAKVNYLDRAGNAYLDLAPIFILIEGKLPKETFLMDKTAKLFTETGLKVICAFLTNDNLLNANYRSIADHADVSMGTIGWVLRELRDQGFTQENYRTREWENKTKLIKKWVEEYPKLRSKSELGTYYTTDKKWWQSIDLDKYDAVFGGELAALNYVDGLEPRDGLLYLGKFKLSCLIRDLKLVNAEQRKQLDSTSETNFTKIELRSKFWGKLETVELLSTATHPLITHADLMDTWEPSNIQTAKKIAARYLLD